MCVCVCACARVCRRMRVRVRSEACACAVVGACAGVGFLGVSVCVGSNRPVGCVKGGDGKINGTI